MTDPTFNFSGIENLPDLKQTATVYIPIGTTKEDYISYFGESLPDSYLSPNVT